MDVVAVCVTRRLTTHLVSPRLPPPKKTEPSLCHSLRNGVVDPTQREQRATQQTTDRPTPLGLGIHDVLDGMETLLATLQDPRVARRL